MQVVGAALSDNVKEIERLLIAAGEPLIFQRRRGLVSTIRLPEAKTIGGDQAGGRLADDSLILHGRHAAPDGPVRAVGRQVGKKGGERPAQGLCRGASGELRLLGFSVPALDIETPTLRDDGTILQTPGYDAESSLSAAAITRPRRRDRWRRPAARKSSPGSAERPIKPEFPPSTTVRRRAIIQTVSSKQGLKHGLFERYSDRANCPKNGQLPSGGRTPSFEPASI
jgi:hypothetical protein